MVSMASRAWVEVLRISRNPIKRGRTLADLWSGGQGKGGRWPSVAPNLADSGGAMEGLKV